MIFQFIFSIPLLSPFPCLLVFLSTPCWLFLECQSEMHFAGKSQLLPLSACECSPIITFLCLCPWQLDNLVRALTACSSKWGSVSRTTAVGKSAIGDYYSSFPQTEEEDLVFNSVWHISALLVVVCARRNHTSIFPGSIRRLFWCECTVTL